MPEKTTGRRGRPRRHHRGHHQQHRRRVTGRLLRLEELGIDLQDVFRFLEEDGVAKFEKSWEELLEATQVQLDAAKK